MFPFPKCRFWLLFLRQEINNQQHNQHLEMWHFRSLLLYFLKWSYWSHLVAVCKSYQQRNEGLYRRNNNLSIYWFLPVDTVSGLPKGKKYINIYMYPGKRKDKNSQLCFEFLYCCSLIWRSDLTCGSSSFFTLPAVFPNPSKPLCSRWDSEANNPSFPYCFLNFARSPFVILRVQNADISENEGTIKSARSQSR